jgi:hypothetical protein
MRLRFRLVAVIVWVDWRSGPPADITQWIMNVKTVAAARMES